MKSTITTSLLAFVLLVALTGCGGGGAGKRALAEVYAFESDPGLVASDFLDVAEKYRAVAASHPEVAEKALAGVQRAQAEYARRMEMIRAARESIADSNRGRIY